MAVRLDVKQPFVGVNDPRDYTCKEECFDPFCERGECSASMENNPYRDVTCFVWPIVPVALGGGSITAAVLKGTGFAIGLGTTGLCVSVIGLTFLCFRKYKWPGPYENKRLNIQHFCETDCAIVGNTISALASATGLAINAYFQSQGPK